MSTDIHCCLSRREIDDGSKLRRQIKINCEHINYRPTASLYQPSQLRLKDCQISCFPLDRAGNSIGTKSFTFFREGVVVFIL